MGKGKAVREKAGKGNIGEGHGEREVWDTWTGEGGRWFNKNIGELDGGMKEEGRMGR